MMGAMSLTAFVLAGGKSSRMGADKAFLVLDGRTLLSRTLDLARAVTQKLLIVGDPERFAAFGEVIQDVFPARGPLGGIHAALTASETDLNLVLAVDTPFLDGEFLLYLAREARQTAALVTVPRVGARFHPLCAVYRRAFRDLAEAALLAGRNRIDLLFAPERTRIIDDAEIAALSFPASMFDNLNTREDFARAESQIMGNAQRD